MNSTNQPRKSRRRCCRCLRSPTAQTPLDDSCRCLMVLGPDLGDCSGLDWCCPPFGRHRGGQGGNGCSVTKPAITTMGMLLSQPLSRVENLAPERCWCWAPRIICRSSLAVVFCDFIFFEEERLKNDAENFIVGLLMIFGYSVGIFCTLPYWTLQSPVSPSGCELFERLVINTFALLDHRDAEMTWWSTLSGVETDRR